MPDAILALGFDLFFKPKLSAAAQELGIEVRYARPDEAVAKSEGATRVVADASAPGVADALEAVRTARPDIPILACYPHVQADLAQRVEKLGGTAMTRGAFNQQITDALAGRW